MKTPHNRPLSVLSENFQPDELPHRKDQIAIIIKQLKRYFEDGAIADNLLLRGRTGTGKTGSLRCALAQIPADYYVFIEGQISRTPVSVLQAIIDKKLQTEPRLITEILTQLRVYPRAIIIDEVEKVTRLADLFTHLNTIHRRTEVPIILATNYLAIREQMPADADETLSFRILPFWEYDAAQLQDILNARIAALPEEMRAGIPEGVVAYICAKAARDGEGNARRARDVLRSCLLDKDFSLPFIDGLFERTQRIDWDEIYRNFARSERRFLHELIVMTLQNEGGELSIPDIRKCTRLSRPRVSNLITFFAEQNVLSTRAINRGYASGRTRRVRFSSNEVLRRFAALDEFGSPANAKDAEAIDVEADGQTVLKSGS